MEIPQLLNKPKDHQENELQALLFKYLRYWPFILLSLIIAGGLAWTYLRYKVPMYEVKSTLMIKDDKKGASTSLSEESVFSDLALLSSNKNIENEIQILKSRMLMEEVVNKLGLNFSYYTIGRIKTSEAYKSCPILLTADSLTAESYGVSFEVKPLDDNKYNLIIGGNTETHEFRQALRFPWGNITMTFIGTNSNPEYSYKIAISNPQDVAAGYAGALKVGTIVSQSTVLELSMIDESPEKAIDILTKLVELYNNAAINDKNKVATKTLDFLDTRINLLTKELNEVEKGIQNYRTTNEVFDLSGESERILDQVTEYDKQLSEFDIQLSILGSIKDYLKKDANTFEFVPSNLAINNLTLGGLLQKFNELLAERERMTKSQKGNNPALITLENQLRNLRSNIIQNIDNIQRDLTISRNKLKSKNSFLGINTEPILLNFNFENSNFPSLLGVKAASISSIILFCTS